MARLHLGGVLYLEPLPDMDDVQCVYLDYNATTPLAPEVLETITTTLKDAWANPSSSHHAGRRARQCIDEARHCVARMINVISEEDIIFTSGGTESNNMVFDSVVRYFTAKNDGVKHPHVIITNLEHDSISMTVQKMQEQNKTDVTVVRADPSTGMVTSQDIMDALRPNTILVSVMLANNETGIIQPLGDIVKAVRRVERESQERRIFVHTDAAQALGKIPVDTTDLGVDYLTIVGHKFYGPRIGALYVSGLAKKKTPLYPMLYGGGQERGYRPGTENTGMIAGLGKAAELVALNVEEYNSHMRSIRDYLEQQLEVTFGGRVRFNGRLEGSTRIPNTCNFSVVGDKLKGNNVLSSLEYCQASVGAACHSHAVSRPSPILLAVGIPEAIAVNALRISVGRETTRENIDVFTKDLKNAVSKLEEV